MARVKNSTFNGTNLYDASSDSPTFTRVLQEVQSDAALIYDKLTGLNGEATLIDHQGDVMAADLRGAPLGIPILNQYIGADIIYASGTTGTAGSKNGATGQTVLLAVPFFAPTAEANLQMRVEIDVEDAPRVVRDASRLTSMSTAGSTDVITPEFNAVDGHDPVAAGTVFADILPGTGLHFLLWEIDSDRRPELAMGLLQWRIHPNRIRNGPGPAVQRSTSDIIGVTSPAATEALAWRDYDASLFADGMPLSSYLTAGINRNLNGLWEYLTGYPAGEDASYTHVDHDGAGVADDVDPARPRFHGGMAALAGYAAIPQFEFPIHCEAFGACLSSAYAVVDAYSSGTQTGLVQWQPILPNRKNKTTVHKAFVAFPDFPAGASSKLKWAVLAMFKDPTSGTDGAGQWTAYVDTVTAEGSSTFTRIGSTNYAYASGTALDFPPDVPGTTPGTNNTVALKIEKTGAAAKAADIHEVQLLGWCLYFDP